MKHLLTFIVSLVSIAVIGQTNGNHVKVNGYTKQNGTYVAPHVRTAPNSSNTDNFSTKPNVNPYTGTQGTIQPDNNSLFPQVFSPNLYPSANTDNVTTTKSSGLSDYESSYIREREEYRKYRFPSMIIRRSTGVKCYLVDEDNSKGHYEYRTKYTSGSFFIDKYEVRYQMRFYSNLPAVYSNAENQIYSSNNEEYKNYHFPDMIIRKDNNVKCYLIDEDDSKGEYEYNTKLTSGNFYIHKDDVAKQRRFYSNLPPVYNNSEIVQPYQNPLNSEQVEDNKVEAETLLLEYLGYSNNKSSIKKFQQDNGLTADGIIGHNTRNALVKAVQEKQQQ